MNTKVCTVCGTEYERRYTESAARWLRRRACSRQCHAKRTEGRPVATRPLIPRERVEAILRGELGRYDGTITIPGVHNARVPDARQSNMAAHIARTTGKSRLNVDRRISMILSGTGPVSRRTGHRNSADVAPDTVDWLLDGLERPDVWWVELADWTRLLVAYTAKQLTLTEYQQQSALYNLIVKAETAAVSTQSKATVSDQRRVA